MKIIKHSSLIATLVVISTVSGQVYDGVDYSSFTGGLLGSTFNASSLGVDMNSTLGGNYTNWGMYGNTSSNGTNTYDRTIKDQEMTNLSRQLLTFI